MNERHCKDCTSLYCGPFQCRFENTVNAYAESRIRSDQHDRLEGKPQHDQDIAGRPLKAGR